MYPHQARTTPLRPKRGFVLFTALTAALAACGGAGGDGTGPIATGVSSITLTTSNLQALDPARDGAYAVWTVEPSGAVHALGTMQAGGTFTYPISMGAVRDIEISLEAPGVSRSTPSAQLLLRGAFQDGHADLVYAGAVTLGDQPLRGRPGQFTMFTPSDNDTGGYPSHEESGVWLFNMAPAETPQKDYYVRMTQLQPGWVYEGWMVRDIDGPSPVWLSYGKFVPDWTGALNQPDDTGWGPFSGVLDYRTARLEDFPGDDWISNPLHLPWSSGLPLPLDLREKDTTGRLRWSHVITIEPATDRGEPITSERPYVLRPYVDSFGDLGPGVARSVTLRASTLPSAVAVAR
jgi:hypothetical protein